MRWLFIAFLFGACTPKLLNTTSTVVKDSIVYETKIVHDTIKVAADNVGIEWLNTVDSTFEERSGRADLKITISNGKSRASCHCDSLVIAKKFAFRDTVHHVIKETVKARETVRFEVSKFDRFCRWFFIACCAAAATYVGVRVFKP